jgi:hypothetical protein
MVQNHASSTLGNGSALGTVCATGFGAEADDNELDMVAWDMGAGFLSV